MTMLIAYWIPKSTNTHSEYVNTYCFSAVKMVRLTRINVTLYAYYFTERHVTFRLSDELQEYEF